MSATRAPTDRSDSRYRGDALLGCGVFFLSSILLPESHPRHHRMTKFLAHERFVSNRLQRGYLRKFLHPPHPLCSIKQNALVSFSPSASPAQPIISSPK
jgi:hypothetical protein